MDKPSLPKKLRKVSVPPPVDDFPVALRDTPSVSRRYRLKPVFLISGLGGLAAIALLIGVLIPRPASQPPESNSAQQSDNGGTRQASAESEKPDDNALVIGESKHFAYQEAPVGELEPIKADGSVLLRKAAAKEYKAMVAAARADGVILVPISGFRSVALQQKIFFEVKEQRGQAASKRAEVSAPPGYSEHHTGYAADLGDGNVPATNLNPTFENTPAFKWLQANAVRFNFEMSFPRNNPQGVSYEPWHWRYVGDRESLETFYKAKNSVVQSPAAAVRSPQPEVSPQPEGTK